MGLGVQELILIFLLVALIFGGKKLPELGKGLGEGIKNFKRSFKRDKKEDKAVNGSKGEVTKDKNEKDN